jgi:hypothetical protein
MRNIRCVCKKCGNSFLWTHEDRIAALESFHPQEAMLDTRKLKIETDRIKKPEFCGGCAQKKNAPKA